MVNENEPTFDQLLQQQITVSIYTFRHLSLQRKFDQYTNTPHCYQTGPAAKTAGSDHKMLKD